MIEPQCSLQEPLIDDMLHNYKEFFAVEFEVNEHQNIFHLWSDNRCDF